MTVAVYPGSFDPITNGHVDIIRRGLVAFERLTVAVAHNPRKEGLFSVAERQRLIVESVAHDPRVSVDAFDGLLVDYAKRIGATVVIRGLRAVSDFEYEFQMANMNRHLHSGMETVFLMTGADFYVSSSLVREVASLGGDIHQLVPAPVSAAVRARFPGESK